MLSSVTNASYHTLCAFIYKHTNPSVIAYIFTDLSCIKIQAATSALQLDFWLCARFLRRLGAGVRQCLICHNVEHEEVVLC